MGTTATATTATATTTDASGDAIVTLITTFHNAERYLGQCLDSIQRQTYGRWRLVLVDDGSTDASLAVARAFVVREPRATLLTGPRCGRRRALQRAHATVRSPFVAWVDADDRLLPTALERTVATMVDAPFCGMVYTNRRYIDAEGMPARTPRRSRYTSAGMLRSFSTFHFRLLRNAALLDVGGVSDRFEVGIDYELCLRLGERHTIVHLDEVLYEYRRHVGQMSQQQRRAQVQASARAVREAIQRRGLADRIRLELEGRRPTFSLREIVPADRPRGVFALAWLAAKSLRRQRSSPAEQSHGPLTARLWPCQPGDAMPGLVLDGLHRASVVAAPLGPTLPALIRAVWTGRTPSLLILGAVASTLASDQAGSAGATARLLAATLDRARAQGGRIAWWLYSDPVAAGLRAQDVARIVSRCDVVIAADRRWLTGAVRDARVLELPPPHPADLVSVRSPASARARLGIAMEDTVVAVIATQCDPTTARGVMHRFAARAGAGTHLMLLSRFTDALLGPSLGSARICNVAPSASADHLAAADAVVFLGGRAMDWEMWLRCVAAGKYVVLPRVGPPASITQLWPGVPVLEGSDDLDVLLATAHVERDRWRALGLALRDEMVQCDPRWLAETLLASARSRGPHSVEQVPSHRPPAV